MANLTNNVSCELFKNDEDQAKIFFGKDSNGRDKLTVLKENFDFFNTCKKCHLKILKI